MTAQWWHLAVIYQIYPRSFADADGDGNGDLDGITSRLDHLSTLGVDALWLNPFYDPRLADLLAEVRTYPDVAAALDDYHEPVTAELLLTLQLAHPDGDLLLHSTVTSFGSPHDVTLAELTIESFFPADAHTRQLLQHLAEAEPTGPAGDH